MTKTKSKIIVLLIAIITLFSTICYAENENTTGTPDPEPRSTEEPTTTSNEEDMIEGSDTPTNGNIHSGDLYIINSNVKMDQLVDGNVYIIGNNVEITGQVAGNVYIVGNTVTFTNSYVQASVYVLANKVTFGGIASDLYIAANSLEIPENMGVYRDMKGVLNTLYLNGIIGRNAFVAANNISLEKDGVKGSIYGDFNYSSKEEINIPEDSVQGDTNFSKMHEFTISKSEVVMSYVFSLLGTLVLTIVIFFLAKWLTPKAVEKTANAFSKDWPKMLGFGLATLVALPIASIILMITVVGIQISFFVLAVYGILLYLSFAAVCLTLAKLIANKKEPAKLGKEFLILLGIAVILWILTIIPFGIGLAIKFILCVLGLGILTYSMVIKKTISSEDKDNKKLEKQNKKEDK